MASHLIANALATLIFIYASARNYPGGDSLTHLQHLQRYYKDHPKTIHIDEYCAENGISQFLNFYPSWQYNKTENLPTESLQQFDYLLIGSQTEDVTAIFQSNFSKSHKELFSVESFFKFTYVKAKKFPYYWPRLKFKQKVIALKKLD